MPRKSRKKLLAQRQENEDAESDMREVEVARLEWLLRREWRRSRRSARRAAKARADHPTTDLE